MDTAIPLTMTPAELQITRNALRAFLDDFGHDEDDVIAAIRGALARVDAALPAAGRVTR